MKVIGAGFGRTGTLSLKLALNRLGFGPCFHMGELLRAQGRLGDWRAVAEGAPPDWDHLLGGWQSTVDWPSARYWAELAAAYPESKVVLTVRDPERWYDSVAETLYRQYEYLTREPRAADFVAMSRAAIWDGVFGGRFTDRAAAIKRFDDHIDEVCAALPVHRLLVYRVSDGWAPLCEFLETDVPDEDFPHANESAAFRAAMNEKSAR